MTKTVIEIANMTTRTEVEALIEAAVLAEREACAKLVESLEGYTQYFPHVPEAIRARGE